MYKDTCVYNYCHLTRLLFIVELQRIQPKHKKSQKKMKIESEY